MAKSISALESPAEEKQCTVNTSSASHCRAGKVTTQCSAESSRPALVLREKSLGIEKSGMMGGGSGGDNGGEQPAASVVEGNPAIDRGQLAGIIASGGNM